MNYKYTVQVLPGMGNWDQKGFASCWIHASAHRLVMAPGPCQ